MRDFKQILNNIAFYAQSEVMGSCCEASNFWRPTNWHIRAIQDLYVDYADRNSPSDKVEFKRILYKLIINADEIPNETVDFVNYLEDFYQSKVLDKFTQAYRKFKDQIDVKFDKKDN